MSGAGGALAERIIGNVALLAVSRIGIPLLLAAALGGSGFLFALDRRVAVLEENKAAAAELTSRRLAALEQTEQRAREDLARRMAAIETIDARERDALGAVRSDVATVAAQVAAILRSVERLERLADRRTQSGMLEGGTR